MTQPVTPFAPTGSNSPLGYDTSCTDSLRTGIFASGIRLLGEACYRRLITPRGMLQGGEAEADYGLDLLNLIGSVNTINDAASLEGQIIAELQKDERVQTASAVVVVDTSGPTIALTITISVQSAIGPFTMVLAVSQVTVALLGIAPGV